MINIFNMKDDIVKVLFYANLVFLAIGIFVSSKTYFISIIVIDIIFTGTFIVISKWSAVFDQRSLGLFGETFGKLGNSLDHFSNLGSQKNG